MSDKFEKLIIQIPIESENSKTLDTSDRTPRSMSTCTVPEIDTAKALFWSLVEDVVANKGGKTSKHSFSLYKGNNEKSLWTLKSSQGETQDSNKILINAKVLKELLTLDEDLTSVIDDLKNNYNNISSHRTKCDTCNQCSIDDGEKFSHYRTGVDRITDHIVYGATGDSNCRGNRKQKRDAAKSESYLKYVIKLEDNKINPCSSEKNEESESFVSTTTLGSANCDKIQNQAELPFMCEYLQRKKTCHCICEDEDCSEETPHLHTEFDGKHTIFKLCPSSDDTGKGLTISFLPDKARLQRNSTLSDVEIALFPRTRSSSSTPQISDTSTTEIWCDFKKRSEQLNSCGIKVASFENWISTNNKKRSSRKCTSGYKMMTSTPDRSNIDIESETTVEKIKHFNKPTSAKISQNCSSSLPNEKCSSSKNKTHSPKRVLDLLESSHDTLEDQAKSDFQDSTMPFSSSTKDSGIPYIQINIVEQGTTTTTSKPQKTSSTGYTPISRIVNRVDESKSTEITDNYLKFKISEQSSSHYKSDSSTYCERKQAFITPSAKYDKSKLPSRGFLVTDYILKSEENEMAKDISSSLLLESWGSRTSNLMDFDKYFSDFSLKVNCSSRLSKLSTTIEGIDVATATNDNKGTSTSDPLKKTTATKSVTFNGSPNYSKSFKRLFVKFRTKICSSAHLNTSQVHTSLRNKIYHPKSVINLQLQKIGVDNLLRASRPAKCCRKAVLNEKQKKMLPYAPSLRSLPLESDDIKVIKESIAIDVKKTRDKSLNLRNEECRKKLLYYINLVKDDFNSKMKHPKVLPKYEIRFFFFSINDLERDNQTVQKVERKSERDSMFRFFQLFNWSTHLQNKRSTCHTRNIILNNEPSVVKSISKKSFQSTVGTTVSYLNHSGHYHSFNAVAYSDVGVNAPLQFNLHDLRQLLMALKNESNKCTEDNNNETLHSMQLYAFGERDHQPDNIVRSAVSTNDRKQYLGSYSSHITKDICETDNEKPGIRIDVLHPIDSSRIGRIKNELNSNLEINSKQLSNITNLSHSISQIDYEDLIENTDSEDAYSVLTGDVLDIDGRSGEADIDIEGNGTDEWEDISEEIIVELERDENYIEVVDKREIPSIHFYESVNASNESEKLFDPKSISKVESITVSTNKIVDSTFQDSMPNLGQIEITESLINSSAQLDRKISKCSVITDSITSIISKVNIKEDSEKKVINSELKIYNSQGQILDELYDSSQKLITKTYDSKGQLIEIPSHRYSSIAGGIFDERGRFLFGRRNSQGKLVGAVYDRNGHLVTNVYDSINRPTHYIGTTRRAMQEKCTSCQGGAVNASKNCNTDKVIMLESSKSIDDLVTKLFDKAPTSPLLPVKSEHFFSDQDSIGILCGPDFSTNNLGGGRRHSTTSLGNVYTSNGKLIRTLYTSKGKLLSSIYDSRGNLIDGKLFFRDLMRRLFDRKGDFIANRFDSDGNVLNAVYDSKGKVLLRTYNSESLLIKLSPHSMNSNTSRIYSSRGQQVNQFYSTDNKLVTSIYDMQGDLIRGTFLGNVDELFPRLFDRKGKFIVGRKFSDGQSIEEMRDLYGHSLHELYKADKCVLKIQPPPFKIFGSNGRPIINFFNAEGRILTNFYDVSGTLLERVSNGNAAELLARLFDLSGYFICGRYDHNGRLIESIFDQYGNRIYQLNILDPQGGRENTLTMKLYNSNGKRISKFLKSDGKLLTGFHDASKNLIEFDRSGKASKLVWRLFDMAGYFIHGRYDTRGSVIKSICDTEGNTINQIYDFEKKVIKRIPSVPKVYNKYGRKINSFYSKSGKIYTSLYDSNGTILDGIMSKNAEELAFRLFDLEGRFIDSRFDSEGNLITGVYDSQGNLIERVTTSKENLGCDVLQQPDTKQIHVKGYCKHIQLDPLQKIKNTKGGSNFDQQTRLNDDKLTCEGVMIREDCKKTGNLCKGFNRKRVKLENVGDNTTKLPMHATHCKQHVSASIRGVDRNRVSKQLDFACQSENGKWMNSNSPSKHVLNRKENSKSRSSRCGKEAAPEPTGKAQPTPARRHQKAKNLCSHCKSKQGTNNEASQQIHQNKRNRSLAGKTTPCYQTIMAINREDSLENMMNRCLNNNDLDDGQKSPDALKCNIRETDFRVSTDAVVIEDHSDLAASPALIDSKENDAKRLSENEINNHPDKPISCQVDPYPDYSPSNTDSESLCTTPTNSSEPTNRDAFLCNIPNAPPFILRMNKAENGTRENRPSFHDASRSGSSHLNNSWSTTTETHDSTWNLNSSLSSCSASKSSNFAKHTQYNVFVQNKCPGLQNVAFRDFFAKSITYVRNSAVHRSMYMSSPTICMAGITGQNNPFNPREHDSRSHGKNVPSSNDSIDMIGKQSCQGYTSKIPRMLHSETKAKSRTKTTEDKGKARSGGCAASGRGGGPCGTVDFNVSPYVKISVSTACPSVTDASKGKGEAEASKATGEAGGDKNSSREDKKEATRPCPADLPPVEVNTAPCECPPEEPAEEECECPDEDLLKNSHELCDCANKKHCVTADIEEPPDAQGDVFWALTKVSLLKDGTKNFEIIDVSPVPPGYYMMPDVNSIVLVGPQPKPQDDKKCTC